MTAQGTVAGLFRHPIKGFSPESLSEATLETGACFPCDRMFAVEDGPCGFDPASPGWISKMRFVVLARDAAVAGVRTRFDEARGQLHVIGKADVETAFTLTSETGRFAFADWLTQELGMRFKGPLRVVETAGEHRFMDHPKGDVSFINRASVDALAQAAGGFVDPARFRGNILADGLPAWTEDSWQPGHRVEIGDARLEVVQLITRCKATHANPQSANYDRDTVPQLFEHFGRKTLGVYLKVVDGGPMRVGDGVKA